VAAVALVGAMAFVLLSGGGGDVPTTQLPPAAKAITPSAQASTPSTSASIPTYAAANAKDPFKALVSDKAAGGATATTPASTSKTTPSTAPTWNPPTTTPTSTVTVTARPTSSPSTTDDVPYTVNVVVLNKIIDDSTVELIVDRTTVRMSLDQTAGPFVLQKVDTVAKTATLGYGDVSLTLQLHQVVLLQQL
jgi:hypothetical protein